MLSMTLKSSEVKGMRGVESIELARRKRRPELCAWLTSSPHSWNFRSDATVPK